MASDAWTYRHDDVATGLTLAADVDAGGRLWVGCSPDRLVGHHLDTAEVGSLAVPEMGWRTAACILAWEGKLLVGLGTAPYYLVYDPVRGACARCDLPAPCSGVARAVRLNWARSLKLGGGAVEYDVCVFADRACRELLSHTRTMETSSVYTVEEMNRMYFVEVRAMDGHRAKNPSTWYPAARTNFVYVPEEQYGWYGVL